VVGAQMGATVLELASAAAWSAHQADRHNATVRAIDTRLGVRWRAAQLRLERARALAADLPSVEGGGVGGIVGSRLTAIVEQVCDARERAESALQCEVPRGEWSALQRTAAAFEVCVQEGLDDFYNVAAREYAIDEDHLRSQLQLLPAFPSSFVKLLIALSDAGFSDDSVFQMLKLFMWNRMCAVTLNGLKPCSSGPCLITLSSNCAQTVMAATI
jgi:hypothetical protein